MPRSRLLAALCLGMAVSSNLWNQPVSASGLRLPGLTLAASPAITDVGGDVLFVLTARSWPGHVTASVSFVSPHHGFTGQMGWTGSCSCFKLAVALAKRVHPLERARATATIKAGTATRTVSTVFQIRGMAANGRGFAPGGTPQLTAWIGDPQPNPKDAQHFCAWVTTSDGLGVPGAAVSFTVRSRGHTLSWSAGKTGTTGVVCAHRVIAFVRAGTTVYVTVYAGSMRHQLQYIPHS
ncbi:MAG TPA: hypothetical protein VKX16_16200 [Chloroflexota bacterium]|nr:hypothetical protein [Chloroflexota bacterium]